MRPSFLLRFFLPVSLLWHCGVPTELGPPFHLTTSQREP